MTAEQIPPMARPRIASGALFLDTAGRVLLLRPTYKNHWDIPGGYVEPGESPLTACRREIQEELGIAPPIGLPLVIDWAPADNEGDKILYVFDGGTLTPEDLSQARFLDGEIAEYRHIDPAELDQFTPARLTRRLRTALTAKASQRTIYTEHGQEPPQPDSR